MDGHCLCGEVTFTVQGEPMWVAHCHCESCRRQTGSLPATFVGYRDNQVTYNKPAHEFESSPGIFRGFCATCGSALHYRPAADREIHLYLGVFDHPDRYRPLAHVHYQEHVEGYELHDALPRFRTLSSDGDGTPMAWGPAKTDR